MLLERYYFYCVAGRGELFVEVSLLVFVAALDDEVEYLGDGDLARWSKVAAGNAGLGGVGGHGRGFQI